MKNIYFIIVALMAIIYVVLEVRKEKFSIKESIYWFFASIVMLVLAVFPKILDSLCIYLGIVYSPSLLFVICILFLLFVNFRNSRRIAEQQEKIIELGQRFAILQEKTQDLRKK